MLIQRTTCKADKFLPRNRDEAAYRSPWPKNVHCAYASAKTRQKTHVRGIGSKSEEKREGGGKAREGGPSCVDSTLALSAANRGLKLLLDVSNAKLRLCKVLIVKTR